MYKITILLIVLSIISCKSSDDNEVSCFPTSTINVNVNIDLPLYQNLKNINGWVYMSQEFTGTRGIIVVRTSENTFKAYDRNAPHICPSTSTTLEVIDDLYIYCPADKSKWILITGQPLEVVNVAPKTYFTSFNPQTNNLIITN